jgi:hypothetical protein
MLCFNKLIRAATSKHLRKMECTCDHCGIGMLFVFHNNEWIETCDSGDISTMFCYSHTMSFKKSIRVWSGIKPRRATGEEFQAVQNCIIPLHMYDGEISTYYKDIVAELNCMEGESSMR